MPQYFDGRSAIEAGLNPPGKYAIAVSRYNDFITQRLLDGALQTLLSAGVGHQDIHVAWVPGAYELPVAAEHLARRRDYAAVICLGAVIRGETTHDQHINRAVSHFLTEIGVRTGIPVLFGLLTCDSVEQAMNRAGGAKGNKGEECAQAALEMVGLLRSLPPL